MIRAGARGSTATETKVSALGLLSAALIATILMLLAAKPAQAATITVTSTADDSAANGNCTLREAIMAANTDAAVDQCAAGQSSDTDTISFNISTGVQTISPSSTLPTITSRATIDGTTQPGFAGSPLIELNGSGAGNGVSGLTITAGSSTVKGLAIYNFAQHGILLETGNGNTIVGNYIGTDASGTALAKGNGNNGVFVNGPDNNAIGGSAPGEGNVISGNGSSGVRLGFTEGTRVQGNRIGAGANGTALGNFHNGVHLDNALDCQIGGPSPEAGNIIAFNGPQFDLDGDGVLDDGAGVVVGSGGGHDILSNSIFSNIGLGIDLSSSFPLDGVTPNDPAADKDADFGPNGSQNFPVLTSARKSGSMTTIKGKLNSADSQTFTIQFFSSPEKDPSGNGEGRTFLGEKPVTTNADGNVSFTFKKMVPKGQFVTATATSSSDGTSEFSNARKVVRRR